MTDISELYRTQRMPLIRLATAIVGDAAAAEDAVQDAFTAVWKLYGAATDTMDDPKVYLRVAVANSARTAVRRRAVRRDGEVVLDLVASAEASVLARAGHPELREALRALPRRQRKVLVLRYWIELSEAEIAQTLGVGRGTVKSSASRGLATLRTHMTTAAVSAVG